MNIFWRIRLSRPKSGTDVLNSFMQIFFLGYSYVGRSASVYNFLRRRIRGCRVSADLPTVRGFCYGTQFSSASAFLSFHLSPLPPSPSLPLSLSFCLSPSCDYWVVILIAVTIKQGAKSEEWWQDNEQRCFASWASSGPILTILLRFLFLGHAN